MTRSHRRAFVPAAFGKNQKGMQASENVDESTDAVSRGVWVAAMESAVSSAQALANLGVHKQLANRLLEPFCWHTVVVTATEWSNFFAQRCHPNAQPEIRTAAEMMRDTMASSRPEEVGYTSWHLPYVRHVDTTELFQAGYSLFAMAEISSARCARVSYLTQDGKRDPDEDVALYRRLVSQFHMSPLEHPAFPSEQRQIHNDGSPGPAFIGNIRGWKQLRKTIRNEDDFSKAGAK